MCNRQSRLQYLLPVLLSILCFPTATPAAVVIDEILADPPPPPVIAPESVFAPVDLALWTRLLEAA